MVTNSNVKTSRNKMKVMFLIYAEIKTCLSKPETDKK